jgi:hypothetical protein
MPFSPVRVDRKGRGSTRLRARLRTPKPLRKQVFCLWRANQHPIAWRLSVSSRVPQRIFNWPLSPSRIYPTRKYIYALKLFVDALVTLPGSLREVFPEIL